jgi:hypothetical protein
MGRACAGLRRIHKSQLVNLRFVNGFQPDPFKVDAYNVSFSCCDELLAVGRDHLKSLQDYFDGLCL